MLIRIPVVLFAFVLTACGGNDIAIDFDLLNDGNLVSDDELAALEAAYYRFEFEDIDPGELAARADSSLAAGGWQVAQEESDWRYRGTVKFVEQRTLALRVDASAQADTAIIEVQLGNPGINALAESCELLKRCIAFIRATDDIDEDSEAAGTLNRLAGPLTDDSGLANQARLYRCRENMVTARELIGQEDIDREEVAYCYRIPIAQSAFAEVRP